MTRTRTGRNTSGAGDCTATSTSEWSRRLMAVPVDLLFVFSLFYFKLPNREKGSQIKGLPILLGQGVRVQTLRFNGYPQRVYKKIFKIAISLSLFKKRYSIVPKILDSRYFRRL